MTSPAALPVALPTALPVPLDHAVPLIVPLVLPALGGLLLIGLIGLVAAAITRSVKRLECARFRDELVDAARLGELDVQDARVFWLIDWFDRVAATGRMITSGRHATERPDSTSLTRSLTGALISDGRRPDVGPSWPAGASWPTGPSWQSDPFGAAGGRDIQTRAVRYQKRKLRQHQDPPRHGLVDVTGHSKPAGGLMPVTGPIPMIPLTQLTPPSGLTLASSDGLTLGSRDASTSVSRDGSTSTPPNGLTPLIPPNQPPRGAPSIPLLPQQFVPARVSMPVKTALTPPMPLTPRSGSRKGASRGAAGLVPRPTPAPRHAGATSPDVEHEAEAEREAGQAEHNALKDQIFAVAAQSRR